MEKIAVYNLLPPGKDFVPFGKWNPSMQGVDLDYYQLIVKQPIKEICKGMDSQPTYYELIVK